jgi:hypothetical protein
MPTATKRGSTPKRKKPVVRIHLREAKLKGYHVKDRADKRRRVLTRGINTKKVSYAEIIRRLNALAVLNKRTHPGTTTKIRADMLYLKHKYRGEKPKKKPTRSARR